MREERRLMNESQTGSLIIYLSRLFRLDISIQTFSTLSYNLILSAFEWQFLNSIKHLNACKRLSSVYLKRAYEVTIFIFWKESRNSRERSIKLLSRIVKMSIASKIWTFHPGLKLNLGLAKPRWNFNSVYSTDLIFYMNFSWKSPYNQSLTRHQEILLI